MPELPEIANRAAEMQLELVGRTIAGVEILQPKMLNVSEGTFAAGAAGAAIENVTSRGKWIFVEITTGWLLINLGMGGEIRLVTRATLPDRWRLLLDFTDGTCLAINFWWFGYVHYVATGRLQDHQMTSRLGPNILEVSAQDLRAITSRTRTAIKTLLLDQERAAGLGNAYVHDVLFLARRHPLRPANSLTEAEVRGLHQAIHDGLQPSMDKGGAFYETGLHGQPGRFTMDDVLVGYKDGKPCPACGASVIKIKTGGTSSYICPACQPLEPLPESKSLLPP
jgi:formamidopyrimidine-DNA glycosylase